ncbi:MAG: LysR family transcriptional regulator [Bdellovibrionaceae bacterium]|nr:LysR family transcriptional regulator [Pseudobdellovibrionaceae bacterium]
MSLSSLSLDAFIAVSRSGSFTTAARELGLTQSALSQRILNLEGDIGAAVFARGARGVTLTALGEKLLHYALRKDLMETELLQELKIRRGLTEVSGHARIAGFSTLNASLLVPALAAFRERYPRVSLTIETLEIREIGPALRQGRVDLAFTTEKPTGAGLEFELVGHEMNVQVRRRADRTTPETFLDHDDKDTTSLEFLRLQGVKSPNPHRDFLGDIHGILAGVRAGLGTAVVPRHLVTEDLRIVPGQKAMKVPVYLTSIRQSYDPRFLTALKESLRVSIARALG